jgi:hypothetical protein
MGRIPVPVLGHVLTDAACARRLRRRRRLLGVPLGALFAVWLLSLLADEGPGS